MHAPRENHSSTATYMLATFAMALGLQSCGSGSPEIPPELLAEPNDDPKPAVGGASGTGGDSSAGPKTPSYPAGPYGIGEGDVVENLTFQGYVDPSKSLELETISFGDYYDPTGEKGVRVLLINASAAWCGPCSAEHSELPEWIDEYGDDGLVIFSGLYQGLGMSKADVETLDIWVDLHGTNFPMVMDPAEQMTNFGFNAPPHNLVVDPTNMKILRVFRGNSKDPMLEFVKLRLEQSAP